MCASSNLTMRRTNHPSIDSQPGLFHSSLWVSVACACMLYGQYANGAGGCGSVCLPLEALNLDKVHVPDHQYRLALITEYAKFDHFREGDSSVTNRGGNEATITQTTLQIDYGLTDRWTTSVLVPYVKKKQQTNKFGTRIAEGLGDISLFGQYELTAHATQTQGLSASLGLGIKFPTGSIDEPNKAMRLPPAFQAGSGAYDLVPTASFHQSLGKGSLFGSVLWRIPLEKNKRGYQFGKELELNVGADYPVSFLNNRFSFQLSVSCLNAGHDRDSDSILPGRLRDGSKVLNTGGNFVDIVPGFRFKISKNFTLQTRFSIPVYEDWNGDRASNVGQVAPNLSTQVTLIYTNR